MLVSSRKQEPIQTMRAPRNMMAARRLVRQISPCRHNQQPIPSTLLAPQTLPPAVGAAGFDSVAASRVCEVSVRHQHQHSLCTSSPSWTMSLLPRHAPSYSSSSRPSFSTSSGVDEIDGGFLTERDFHSVADATLDEVQALVDGLEDTVDDYEANLSVRYWLVASPDRQSRLVASMVLGLAYVFDKRGGNV